MFAAALEVSTVDSNWLAIALFAIGAALLFMWAIPFFQMEWNDARSELRLDRMGSLQQLSALGMSIDEQGRVTARATVTGRFWFQSPVVVDDLYVQFSQPSGSRWRRWARNKIVRAPLNEDSRALAGLPVLSGLRLEAGQVIRLDQSLFSQLDVMPDHPARHGKFHADMYVALLVPHRTVKLALGEENVAP